jgi:acetyltransferase-like isoleucine patch superfamily enzyme
MKFFASFIWTLPLRILGVNLGSKCYVSPFSSWPFNARVHLGNKSQIHQGVTLAMQSDAALIHIGNGVMIGRGCSIVADAPVIVGDGCLFGFNVLVMSHRHASGAGRNPVTDPLLTSKGIRIGKNCFIGCNAVILDGVELGNSCTVGAGAVVTKSFSSGSKIAGVPARLI